MRWWNTKQRLRKLRVYSLPSCWILRKIWIAGTAEKNCDSLHVSDHAGRTGRTKTGTAFYGRCNGYGCRAIGAVGMDDETANLFQKLSEKMI
jgi:hypothetical protein